MYAFFAKVKRPLMAVALVLGIGAGAASAVDYYFMDRGQPQYIGYSQPMMQTSNYYASSDACSPCAAPAPMPAPVVACAAQPVCDPCGSAGASVGVASSNLPGNYSNDYFYTQSSQVASGINYIIPTQNGYIESATIPLTNPVDRYYATHVVRNGEVVDIGNPINRNFANTNDAMSLAQYVTDIQNNPSLAQGQTLVMDGMAASPVPSSLMNAVPTGASATIDPATY